MPRWLQGPRTFLEPTAPFPGPRFWGGVAYEPELSTDCLREPKALNVRCSQPAADDVDAACGEAQPLSTLADFLRAFEENTGWPLRFVPGRHVLEDPEVLWAARLGTAGQSVGELRLSLGGSPAFARGRVDLEVAAALANSYATLLDDLLQTRRQLEQREAELMRLDRPSKPGGGPWRQRAKLMQQLRLAAEAVNGQTATIYLLDEAPWELVFHAAWGLPAEKGGAPRRPLGESRADLEALAGYAVTLESRADMAAWNVPIECQSAVCLPIASATQVLGTLWVFSQQAQDVSDRQVNATEIIAGQIATELERELRLTAFARETADALCR